MDEPANTLGYFIAGYAVIFVSILVYIVSLILRGRNLKQDEDMLTELEKTKQ
jgi:CcmD family protein